MALGAWHCAAFLLFYYDIMMMGMNIGRLGSW